MFKWVKYEKTVVFISISLAQFSAYIELYAFTIWGTEVLKYNIASEQVLFTSVFPIISSGRVMFVNTDCVYIIKGLDPFQLNKNR